MSRDPLAESFLASIKESIVDHTHASIVRVIIVASGIRPGWPVTPAKYTAQKFTTARSYPVTVTPKASRGSTTSRNTRKTVTGISKLATLIIHLIGDTEYPCPLQWNL